MDALNMTVGIKNIPKSLKIEPYHMFPNHKHNIDAYGQFEQLKQS